MDKSRWYYGELIDRCGRNSSGMRWGALVDGVGYLKADTLAGLKSLIRHERRRAGLPVRTVA